MVMAEALQSPLHEKTLLIVDDDAPLRNRVARAMEARGFVVQSAASVAEGLHAMTDTAPAYALVDMRLEDGNGLEIIKALREARPDIRIVMLTAYGNIATAVAAVKAGAIDYLPKPADADQIYAALTETKNPLQRAPVHLQAPGGLGHIPVALFEHPLDMLPAHPVGRHRILRRTLQRILNKHAPRN